MTTEQGPATQTNTTIASIEDTFTSRLQSINSVLGSYKDLHGFYVGALKGVNANATKALERAEDSIRAKQNEISQGLYTQSFVLLTGVAEALLKDIFEDLFINNFMTIRGTKGIDFNVSELQAILRGASASEDKLEYISNSLGRLAFGQLEGERNPQGKINLQNVETMVTTFKKYLRLDIPDGDGLKSLHRYWQIRHVIIHNDGKINERFIHNVRKVGLLKEEDSLGRRLQLSKADYNAAKTDFNELFSTLDTLVRAAGLTSRFVDSQFAD